MKKVVFLLNRGYKSDKALFIDKNFNINSNSNCNYKKFNIKLNVEYMAGKKKILKK